MALKDVALEQQENNAAWQAILEEKYDEALAIYSVMLQRRDGLAAHMNRGITRLLIGDYSGAEADFRSGRNHPDRLPARMINLKIGVALWLQNQPEAACADWANEILRTRSGDITHADEAEAPALLWWASAHSELRHWRELAEEELSRQSARADTQSHRWPQMLVPFLLGAIGEERLLSGVEISTPRTTFPNLNLRRVAAARFYIGAVSLDKGDFNGYREQLSLAEQLTSTERTAIVDPEYYLTGYALKDIQGRHPQT